MSASFDKLEALFHEALTLRPAERSKLLARVSAHSPAAGRQLEELLQAQNGVGGFLAESPQEAATHKLDLPEDRPDEAVGQTLGRYKLLERVGEGGCGVVYVAEQTEPVRRRVALKVIKLGMDTKSVVARFEAERQALAMMDHPNIAKVLDAGSTDSGRPYFVMELVRGIRITDYCDEAQLSTRDRLELFIKVCQAIQHAHQKGIIHRDIKPSNILVTLNDGVAVPKVIDFGIAKATEGRLTDGTVYTQLHQFIGTPAYMSPEQADMSSLDIDTRGDIYSLGVLLYELLTGSTPFDARELMEHGIDAMRKTLREQEPQRPSTRLATLGADDRATRATRRATESAQLMHQLNGDLDWIVMKCLEKDRQRRYETANGLASDLRRHLLNEPVTARPPTTAYRLERAFRRNKLAFTAAAAVALALLAGFGVSTWQTVLARSAERKAEEARKGEQEQRLEAQVRQVEAEAERARARSEQQRADIEAHNASASQEHSRRLLYAADMNLAQHSLRENNLGRCRRLLDRHRPKPGEEDLRGWEWRYLWQLTRSSALVTLTNGQARGFDVSFSADGRRLAMGWYDGRVDLWDVPGQRLLRPLMPRSQSHKAQVAFSPVRNLLLGTSKPGTVTLYDLDTGLDSVFWRAPEGEAWEVRDLSFSPDGSKAVIYAGLIDGDGGDAAWVVDVGSHKIDGRYLTTAGLSSYSGAAQFSPDHRRLYLSHSRNVGFECNVQCLDLATGSVLWETETQTSYGITTLAVSPDGKVLAAGSGFVDPTIRIFDADTGQLRSRLEGHTGWVSKLVFSGDGKRLISAGSDQTIRSWETAHWTEATVLRGHTDEIHSVALSDATQLIASTGKDGNLLLWRADGTAVADGYRQLPPGLAKRGVMPLDSGRILLLPGERSPELVDLRRNVPPTRLDEVEGPGAVLGWLPGEILCKWTAQNEIVVLQWRKGEFIRLGSIKGDSGRPTGVAYNGSHHLLAWAEQASPTSLFIADLTAPGRRVELSSDVPGLVPFSFSEDGSFLVAGTKKPFSQRLDPLRAWQVDSGKIVVSIAEPILAATLAGAGKVLVTTSSKGNDHEISFRDLTHPELPPRRVSGSNSSEVLAVSPDERLVASSTGGGLVRLFDPLKGELVANLQGHLNAVLGIAFSPDGRRLISSYGGREAIKLWDVGTRQELLTLSGSLGGQLFSATWSSDGEVILAEEPWQAWRAPSWEEIAAIEARDPRP